MQLQWINAMTQVRVLRSSQMASLLPLPVRNMSRVKTRHRAPRHYWPKKEAMEADGNLTSENQEFLQEMINDRLVPPHSDSPCAEAWRSQMSDVIGAPWTPGTRRCGLIAKKIGVVPMWLKNGKYVTSTMLHVSDNHVVKHLSVEELNRQPAIRYRWKNVERNYAGLVVGADQEDPRRFTKAYCGLFASAGLLPTRRMARFVVSPSAVLAPGTKLRATHFDVSDYVDVWGRTIERGFQGVMKRWGFKGMPATHGTTKSHRRPGSIGSGCDKARVWAGQKMPGHMGGDFRGCVGCKILRINTKYDVIYVLGHNIPGGVGNYVLMYDTLLPHKRRKEAPKVWTGTDDNAEIPEDLYHPDVHRMDEPTIQFN